MKINFKDVFTKSALETVESVRISNYLMFDIECVPEYKSLNDATEEIQKTWCHICDRRFQETLKSGKTYEDIYWDQASLYVEFSKIVCISVGRFIDNEFYYGSIAVDNKTSDVKLIKAFTSLVNKFPNFVLVGFNINNYDIPMISKRAIKYEYKIPDQLNMWKHKPWEKPVLDLFDFWKQSVSGWPSLEQVACFLGYEGYSKNLMHGNDVKIKYYDENNHLKNIEEIVHYCEKDIDITSFIFKKIYDLNLIST